MLRLVLVVLRLMVLLVLVSIGERHSHSGIADFWVVARDAVSTGVHVGGEDAHRSLELAF